MTVDSIIRVRLIDEPERPTYTLPVWQAARDYAGYTFQVRWQERGYAMGGLMGNILDLIGHPQVEFAFSSPEYDAYFTIRTPKAEKKS
jgi:hypothetical protein